MHVYITRASSWGSGASALIDHTADMSTSLQNLMDYAQYVWTDALTIETCKPTDPMCREPEPLGDQWADVTNAAASTFTVPNGTFIVQMKADALWTHEGFELIWGPPGPRVCGDGAMDFGYETCDDGNTVDGGPPLEIDAHACQTAMLPCASACVVDPPVSLQACLSLCVCACTPLPGLCFCCFATLDAMSEKISSSMTRWFRR
jgi:hypothetical protein